MKWKTQIELSYRAYVRQTESTELRLHEVCNKIQDRYPVRASFSPHREEYWPVNGSQVAVLEKRGYLIITMGHDFFIPIRVVDITIVCDTVSEAHEQLKTILDTVNDSFAVARIVQEFITEIHAV